MATVKKKVRAATSLDSATQIVPHAELEFCVYRDNSARYACEIVDGRGDSLTHSAGFVARGDAEGAVRCMQHGAGSTRLAFDVPKQRQVVAV